MLSLPFTLIWLKNKRKGIIVCLIGLLLCYFGYNKVLLPAFKISNTSIREVLSIPFQQTARLAKYHDDAFSDEDKECEYPGFKFRPKGAKFRVSLLCGIWQKDKLIKVLEKDANPWEIEIEQNSELI